MLRDTYCYTKACFAQTVPVKATETFFLDRLAKWRPLVISAQTGTR